MDQPATVGWVERSGMPEPTEIASKATEFGEVHRKSGWRLGWLVASSCYMQDKPGRPSKSSPERINGKITTGEFAALADVSPSHVHYYFRAWELAAEAGQVPAAKDVPNEPNWDSLLLDYGLDEFDDQEDIEQHWSFYYQLAKRPKPQVVEQDSKPKKPEKDKPTEKPVEVVETKEDSDESESIPVETQAELARKDKHNKIVESAESLERVADRFDQIGEVEEPDDIQAVQEIVAKAEAIAAKGRELLKLKAVPKAM